ncbi:hypothetical protein D3C81_2175360 [compost metagenome]
MPVGIDQSGAEQRARQFADFGCLKLQGFITWTDEGNSPVTNAQAMLLEHHASRFDRD